MKVMQFSSICAFSILMFMQSILPIGAIAQQVWENDILLRATDREISSRAVALDSLGNAHIISSSDYLYYSWFDGEKWLHETIDPPAQSVSKASIGIGPGGMPHILFYIGLELMHASRRGSSWEFMLLGTVSQTNVCDVRFDSNGNPHTAFISSDRVLVHARMQNGTWSHSQILTDVYDYSPWGFDLDTSDNPHFCYWSFNQADRGLHYLYQQNSEWKLERVDSEGRQPEHTSLRIDSGNRPHIVTHPEYRNEVVYWQKTNETWISRTIQGIDFWGDMSFFLDETQNPHIVMVFQDIMTHVYCHDEIWERESIDPGCRYFRDIAGIADRSGRICITGRNQDYSQLICFEGGPGQWHDTVLAEFGGYGNCSAVIDRDGCLNSLFTGQSGNCLFTGCRTSNGWSFQLLETLMGADSGQCCIGVDGIGNLHISYYHYRDRALYHAVKICETWEKEIVFEGPVVFDSEMVTYGDGNVAILLSTDENLVLCRKSAGIWERDQLESGSHRSVSLCVDATEAYHCAYYRKTDEGYYNSNLMYRFLDHGVWVEESVDSSNCGEGNEIVKLHITSKNKPVIFYGKFTLGTHGQMYDVVNFSSNETGKWDTIQFGTSTDIYAYSSCLDYSDFPCLASGPTLYFLTDASEIMKSNFIYGWNSDESRHSLLIDDEGRFHLLHTADSSLCYTRQTTPTAGVRLEMPNQVFLRNRTIYLNAYLRSTGQQHQNTPLCILLEYQQNYWFWPEWTGQFNVEYVDVHEKGSALLAIPSFYYQEPLPQPIEGLTFWGALLNDDMTEILGGFDGIGKWEFSIQ